MKTPDFLNVDLEITSDSSDLLKLAEDLKEKANILNADVGKGTGDYFVRIESNESSSDQEIVIHNLCSLVEGFSKEQKMIWDGAKSRIFDVGYDQHEAKRCTCFKVAADSLRRIAALNADVGVSVYRTDEKPTN